jgi:hypothetical protein
VVALALVGGVLSSSRPAPAAGYAPEPYCQLHVLGSLYGDASGNGPANGAAWNPSTTTWKLRAGNASTADRFERCARWMVTNDVGGNAGAKVARRNNAVTLTGFWPAGQGAPFLHGQMTAVVAAASPLGKRAFIMSVIEGEGEVCDPAAGACDTAQIADNSRTIGGGTNPEFYEHIVALLQPAIDAGFSSAFTATGRGCVPQSVEQLAAGGQAALCIRSSDFAVIKDWPVTTCNRVPGYGHLAGYVCGQPDEAPTPPPPPSPASIDAFGSTPDPVPPGGPGALHWSTTGLDADSCKVRVGGTTLAKQLPTNEDSWPIPAGRIKDGTKFSLVCTAGGVKQSAETVLVVA